MARHKKITRLLLAPIVISIGIIGWSLYFTGSKKCEKSINQKTRHQPDLVFGVLPQKEQIIEKERS